MRFLALAPLCALFCCSCASIISGTHDTVSVNSLDPGATIYIDGVARGVGSATAEVKRGKRHTIKAEKEGCQPVMIETSESFDPTTLLGILIDFGIVTIPIDLLTGAAWKQEPTLYTVTPVPIAATPRATPSP